MKDASSSGLDEPLHHPALHTILVVDDEWIVRMPISEYLRDCGYAVLEASDASEAISMIDHDPPVEMVFSDIRMPGNMDGVALAKWLRAHHPEIPVILTSGYAGRTALPAMISDARFIAKPYSQAQVAHRIALLLDWHEDAGDEGRPDDHSGAHSGTKPQPGR